MQRKVFDILASAGGAVLVAVLLVAGGLLMWGYSFANSNVHTQLAEQQIVFPPLAAFASAKPGTEITPSMIPYIEKYAGQQLTTGAQAEAYADHFIAIHLQEIGGGKTYAQLSTIARSLPPGSAAAAKAEATVTTVFQGTTLRGLLLEAYGYWTFGQIALWGAIASFILAGVMAMLVGLGLWHSRRVATDAPILAGRTTETKAAD
ncbi:MAG: hypothetical protein ABSE47_02955 [Acidimicrobiales bacterium]|jgi:hypothetical protein